METSNVVGKSVHSLVCGWIGWIPKIRHDPKYLMPVPWELRYCSTLRSCRILSINSTEDVISGDTNLEYSENMCTRVAASIRGVPPTTQRK